ncbi:MAG TPA: zinc-ribbon domain-containing protein [Pyrinomonadaceae bacterium]|nr:zinc-ribbon domain-containing protein [Pyrinomonadaceae bacterium]
MSVPEISRRCLACGASVRAGARFCPQCGNNMGEGEAHASGAGGPGDDLLDVDALKETFEAWESAPPPGRATHAPAADERSAPPPDARTQDARSAPAQDARNKSAQGAPAPPSSSNAPPPGATPPPPARAEGATTRAEGVTRRDEARQTFAAGDGAPQVAPRATSNVMPPALPASSVTPPTSPPLSVPPDTTPVPASPSSSSPAGERRRGRAVAAVEERIGPRVEKLREASMGVLEEASEDTGLRFVLVALALFLLALVLIVFNAAVK